MQREIMFFFSEIHKRAYAHCWQNKEFLNVKYGSTYSNEIGWARGAYG